MGEGDKEQDSNNGASGHSLRPVVDMNSLLRRKKSKRRSAFSLSKGGSVDSHEHDISPAVTMRASAPPNSLSVDAINFKAGDSAGDSCVSAAPSPIDGGEVHENADEVFGGGSCGEENSATENVSLNDKGHDGQADMQATRLTMEAQPTLTNGGAKQPVRSESESNLRNISLGLVHYADKVMDEIYTIDIERMFQLLFSDCPMQFELAKRREIQDLVQTPWPEQTAEDGTKTRNITYTVPLNVSFCPKRSDSVEKQVLYPISKPGKLYVVDTDTETKGIPYGDSFTVATRYCLSKVSRYSCRLHISSTIKFRKGIMALIKNLIHKAVTNGIINNFGHLAELLNEEACANNGMRKLSQQEVGRRRRGSEQSTAGSGVVNRLEDLDDQEVLVPTDSRHGGTFKSSPLVRSRSLQQNGGSMIQRSLSSESQICSNFTILASFIFIILIFTNIAMLVSLYTSTGGSVRQPGNMASSSHRFSTSDPLNSPERNKQDGTHQTTREEFDSTLRYDADLYNEHLSKIYKSLTTTTEVLKTLLGSLDDIKAALLNKDHEHCAFGQGIFHSGKSHKMPNDDGNEKKEATSTEQVVGNLNPRDNVNNVKDVEGVASISAGKCDGNSQEGEEDVDVIFEDENVLDVIARKEIKR